MNDEELYPCASCGELRTKAEGGTTFTVCDECWDKHYKSSPLSNEDKVLDEEKEQL